MTFNEVLRADYVKRWQIVNVARQQTVAEHSFNVTTIAMEIAERFMAERGFAAHAQLLSFDDIRLDVMRCAHWHDIPEVMTGDIHTDAKALLGIRAALADIERDMLKNYDTGGAWPLSEYIVKAADYIDAVRFLGVEGRGPRAGQIKAGLEIALDNHIGNPLCPDTLRIIINSIAYEAINDVPPNA